MLDVLLSHPRHDHRTTSVLIEGSIDEDVKVLVSRAREQLRQTDYKTYLFVTENPLPDPNNRSRDYPRTRRE